MDHRRRPITGCYLRGGAIIGGARGGAHRKNERWVLVLTLLALLSRLGDKALNFQVGCSQNGTAVLEGLRRQKGANER